MAMKPGLFVWHELLTTDPAAAKRFYGEVVGWDTAPWNDSDYEMWMASDGAPVGGVMQLPDEAKQMGAPPHWMANITTPDVDKTVEAARKLGATILKPAGSMPGVGRFAIIQDPQGATFSAFQPETDMPEATSHPNGYFSWHELATTDQKGAIDFYTKVFDLKKDSDFDMGEMGNYEMFRADGGMPSVGIMTKPPQQPGPSAWLHYVVVDSADDAADRITKAGGTVVVPPMDIPGGDRIAVALDPQGAAFGVHSKGNGRSD